MRLRSWLVLISLSFSYAIAAANTEDTCKAFIHSHLHAMSGNLKKPMTVYHWFTCDSMPGYTKSSTKHKGADAYIKDRMHNSQGAAGTGLYAAPDPSSSCDYGLGQTAKESCVLAIDIPSNEYVSRSDSIIKRRGVKFEDVAKAGCVDQARLEPALDAFIKKQEEACKVRKCSEKEQRAEVRFDKFIDESDDLTDFMIDLDGVTAKKYFVLKQSSAPVSAYRFSTVKLGTSQINDPRALVLRPSFLPKLQYRIYDTKDLQKMKSPETSNIVNHLLSNEAGQRCSHMFKNKLKKPKVPDPSFNEWLANLGSEVDFKELFADQTLIEPSAKPRSHL